MKENDSVKKIKLHDYGFTKAGQTVGDPNAFEAELNSIFQGRIIDETIRDSRSEDDKEKIRKEISLVQQEKARLNESIKNIESEILSKEDAFNDINKEIEAKRLGKDTNSGHSAVFSWMKFNINLLFLIPLSVYLFLFYVATIYKVFYFDAIKIADSIANGQGSISPLPAPGELSDALSFNYLLLFAPFVFYAFGYAIHVLLDLRTKLKYVYIFLVLTVTFALDFLMAYMIHRNTADAKSFMGSGDDIPLFEDPNFYIILFMGFVVYLIWSILLNSLIAEWKKRDVIARLNEIKKEIRNEIENKKLRIREINAELAPKNKQIEYMEESLKGFRVPLSDLLFCLSEFNAGWLQYMTALPSLSDSRNKCVDVYTKFLNDNGMRE